MQNQAGINISTSEQDSLIYQSAEALYQSGNCSKAIPALSEYISLFPKGNFILSALYSRADCLFKSNSFNDALSDFKKVIALGPSKYLENSLLKATYITYEKQSNFTEAFNYYKQLNDIASLQSNQEIALIGMLRCNFKLKKI